MKTKRQLRDYYHTKLQEEIHNIKRISTSAQYPDSFYNQITLFFLVLGIVLIYIAFNLPIKEGDDYLFGTIFFFGMISLVSSSMPIAIKNENVDNKKDAKKKQYENTVLKKLIHYMDSPLSFHPSRSISKRQAINTHLLDEIRLKRYSGENLCIALINNIKVEFSEIHSIINQNNLNTQTSYRNDMLLIAEFPRSFSSKLFILPDKNKEVYPGLIGSWLQNNNFTDKNVIKMDNIEFERYFFIYGNDDIEARYILTHTVMEQLLKIRKKSTSDISISFSGGKMNILFPNFGYKNMINSSSNIEHFEYIRPYIDIIYSILDMISLLKLDDKIWNKK